MKKYIHLLAVFALTLTVIGLAWNSPAWASGQPSAVAKPLFEIEVGESGSYTVGGLCQFNAVYKGSGASAKVAVDISSESFSQAPNTQDLLYLGGCRVEHFVMNEVVSDEMSPAYGSWEICFGDRPGEQLTIYRYDPKANPAAWLPLVTTAKDGMSCAPANYSGVYAPGSQRIATAGGPGLDNGNQSPPSNGGTVRPPSPSNTGKIKKSGTYNIGGVASFIANYISPQSSSVAHVEKNIEVSVNVPFPDDSGLLYLPGVHVFHFIKNKLIKDAASTDGSWKICFAAIPDKETTIYFYYASDETAGSVTSDWLPLETTIENGMACAPADHTGVYAPAGK
jgi:hypothetical protein